MGRTSRSRYTILACLSVRPMSGYDIKQFLEQTVGHFWSESYGQIYPTLKTLEAEGRIERRDDEDGDRGRRVYRLTGKGRETLRAWLAEPPEPDVPRYELSLKVFFGDQVPVETTVTHLREHRARHAELLERYSAQEIALQERMADSPKLPYWLAVLRGGIRYSRLVVEWCDETEASLRSLEEAGGPFEGVGGRG